MKLKPIIPGRRIAVISDEHFTPGAIITAEGMGLFYKVRKNGDKHIIKIRGKDIHANNYDEVNKIINEDTEKARWR